MTDDHRVIDEEVLALALMMTLGAGQAHATCQYWKHLSEANGTIAISYGKAGDISEIGLWSNANAKPAAVKISNKSLAYVNVTNGQIDIAPKKTGTATLTYRSNHKKHTVKIKVYKYQNPCASLTIGGKQYKGKLAKSANVWIGSLYGKKSAPKGTLKIKGASNWQVKEIMAYGGGKTIKNGSKITKNMGDLMVTMYNKKTKVTEIVYLFWY